MLTLLLSPLLSLLIGTAHADPYLVIGTGQAKLNQVDINGHWVQEGYAHIIDEQANTLKLGVGVEVKPWLDLELDYRDLGEFNSMIRFVADKDYGKCKPCDVRTAWLHGETRGVVASAVMAPDWNVAPLLRVGAMWHWSAFLANYARGNGIKTYEKDILPFKDVGFNYVIGVGAKTDRLLVEATWYPNVSSQGSAYHDVYEVSLSVRF